MNRRTFIRKVLPATALTAVVGFPILNEHQNLKINHYHLGFKNLPLAFDGLKIAHLTDLHLGPQNSSAYINEVVKMANDLEPDLTFCTGDYVQGRNTEVFRKIPPCTASTSFGRLCN